MVYKVTLFENNSISNTLTISENKNVELDLNGKTITVFYRNGINNYGKLSIDDSSDDKLGKLDVIGSQAVYNEGYLVVNEGNIKSTATTINNKGAGSVIVNGGYLTVTATSYLYVIESLETGSVEINGGVLRCQPTNQTIQCQAWPFHVNANTVLKFNGGKVITTQPNDWIYPYEKQPIIPQNKYFREYISEIDGIKYRIAEVLEGNIKVTNYYDETVEYYGDLQTALDSAPTNGKLTQVQLLTDLNLTAGVAVNSGRNVQLDLNGKKLSFYSNSQGITGVTNNDKFELIDSIGDGKIEVKVDGYDAYGIVNSKGHGPVMTLKSGIVEVTSVGANAYALSHRNTNGNGELAMTIEGGNYSAKSETGTNTTLSGIAYGLYNDAKGSLYITGNETTISAVSDKNTSYGIYDNGSISKINMGENDGLTSNASPYIEGGTYGIYRINTYPFYVRWLYYWCNRSINLRNSNRSRS